MLPPRPLQGLLELAEQALRTWEPCWSGFLAAELREQACTELETLSELAVASDGGWPHKSDKNRHHGRDGNPRRKKKLGVVTGFEEAAGVPADELHKGARRGAVGARQAQRFRENDGPHARA